MKSNLEPHDEIHFKIALLRKDRNISQTEMAELLGISQNAYSRIERGKTKLTLNRIQEIADVLGIPYDDFIKEKNQTLETIKPSILEQQNREKEVLELELESLRNKTQEQDKTIKALLEALEGKNKIISLLEEVKKLLESKIKEYESNAERLPIDIASYIRNNPKEINAIITDIIEKHNQSLDKSDK